MREILFRGKAANRIDGRAYRTSYKNGDWVCGLLTDVENYAGFSEMTNTNGVSGIEVDKNTVGQFAGLTDKNGKKIFEGDICRVTRPCVLAYGKIIFQNGCFWFVDDGPGGMLRLCDIKMNGFEIEVIGNIHDNPELMAVKTSPNTEGEPE